MAEQNELSNPEMKRLGSDPIPLLKQQHPTGGNTLHGIPPFSALFGQHFGSTPLTTIEGQCRVHPLTRSFVIVDKSSNGDSRVFLVPEFSGKRGGLLEGGICTTTTTTSATSPSNPISDAVITSSEGATTTRSPIETTTQCFSQHRVNKKEKEKEKDDKEGEGEGEGKGEDEDEGKEEQSNGYSDFHEDSDEIDALMNSDDYEIGEGEDGEDEEDNDIYGEVTSAFTPLIEEEFSASTPSVKGDAANLRKRKGGEREMDSSSTKRFIASGSAEDNLNPNLNLNLNLLQEYEPTTRSVKMARNQKIQECVRMLRKIVPTRGGIGFDPALVLDDVIEHVTMLQNEVASLLQAKTEL